MATETFDKTIYIDEKAAKIIADELEKPRKPFVNKIKTEEVNRSAKEWLKQRESLLKKLSEQSKK